MAMSDRRFVSVAIIVLAGESELPTVNWPILVHMSDERFSRNWDATILQAQSRSFDVVQAILAACGQK